MDFKGKIHPLESLEALTTAIREERDPGIDLIWTPASKHMILPEELAEASAAVLASRQRLTTALLRNSLDKLRWFGTLLAGLTVFTFYQAWVFAPNSASTMEHLGRTSHAILSSIPIGITLLIFLIFAFIPWYQARKRLSELSQWTDGDSAAAIPTLRFETWLEYQKAPITWFLLGLITLVGIAQCMPGDAPSAAGLVKIRYLHGDWWRLFTAPFLHGNVLHFLMNASAMLYLGKRMEVFARWPHVPLVFLFAACVGGESSARLVQASTIGASGGLMGWLGFLLLFESLHGRLVPKTARRRLLAGVALTAIIGLIGYRFVDNAAHLGGLLAGMLYAIIVFPKSTSPHRPQSNITDRIVGGASLAILIVSALTAILKILSH